MPHKFEFDKIVEKSKTFKDGLMAVAASLITLAAERSIEATLFRCPCEPIQRQLYSSLFIAIPTVILLFVGIAFNMKVWKLITGCWSTKKCRCSTVGWKNFCSILAFAVISPTTWIILTLIDGDYLACAWTQVAYEDIVNVTCIPVSMHDCKKTQKEKFEFFRLLFGDFFLLIDFF